MNLDLIVVHPNIDIIPTCLIVLVRIILIGKMHEENVSFAIKD